MGVCCAIVLADAWAFMRCISANRERIAVGLQPNVWHVRPYSFCGGDALRCCFTPLPVCFEVINVVVLPRIFGALY